VRGEPLEISINPGQSSDEIVLQLTGPLILDNLFNFQRSWREQSASSVMVDLSQVPYIDSSGIGSLVNLYVSRQKIGGSVYLMGVSDRVMTALAVTRVDKIFSIVGSSRSNAAQA
jgi:anti-sigma B factor antagonist